MLRHNPNRFEFKLDSCYQCSWHLIPFPCFGRLAATKWNVTIAIVIAAVIRVATGNGSNPGAKEGNHVQTNVSNDNAVAVAYTCISLPRASQSPRSRELRMYTLPWWIRFCFQIQGSVNFIFQSRGDMQAKNGVLIHFITFESGLDCDVDQYAVFLDWSNRQTDRQSGRVDRRNQEKKISV